MVPKAPKLRSRCDVGVTFRHCGKASLSILFSFSPKMPRKKCHYQSEQEQRPFSRTYSPSSSGPFRGCSRKWTVAAMSPSSRHAKLLACQVPIHSISPSSSYLGGNCPVAVLVKELEGLFELGHLLLRQVLHGAASYYPSSSSLSSYGFRVGDPFQSGERISGCFPFPTLERPEQRPRHGFRAGPRASPPSMEKRCLQQKKGGVKKFHARVKD